MKKAEAISILATSVRPREAKDRARYDKAVKMAIEALRQPEIIRCKDCLHWVRTCGDNHWGLGDCDVFDKHLVMCEGYCAWAERREE